MRKRPSLGILLLLSALQVSVAVTAGGAVLSDGPSGSDRPSGISQCIQGKLETLTDAVIERLGKDLHESMLPIKPVSGLTSRQLLNEERRAIARLERDGVKLVRTEKQTRLEFKVKKGLNPDVAPGPDGSKFYGSVYVVSELPPAVKKGTPETRALEHPEMKVYLQKLRAAGYELAIDTSSRAAGAEAYQWDHIKVIAISPLTNWRIFLHEFQHFDFAKTVTPHYYTLVEQRTKHGVDLLKNQEWVRTIGYEKLKRIQKLIDRGITPKTAVDEQLAVDTELSILGWKRYFPGAGMGLQQYALKHQIKELHELGNRMTDQQKVRLIKSRLTLWSLRFIENSVPIAIPVTAGVGTAAYLALKASTHNYSQVYYDHSDNVIGVRADGSVDLLRKEPADIPVPADTDEK